MEIDWVLVALVALTVCAGAVAVWLMFARERDAELVDAVSLALATVARLARDMLGERELEALALWAYDLFGVSRYYSEDDWVRFVLRVMGASAYAAADWKGVDGAEE